MEATPSFFMQRTPSVSSTSTTRRPRGFQPSEVNKTKHKGELEIPPTLPQSTTHLDSSSNIENIKPAKPHVKPTNSPISERRSTAPAQAKTLTEALIAQVSPSKESPVLEAFQKGKASATQNGATRPAVGDGDQSKGPKPVGQMITAAAPRPKADHRNVNTTSELSSNGSSSVQIVTNDERSCWSKAVTKAAWDNSTYPIDNPNWRKDSDHLGITGVNFHNLPPYKSPFKTSEGSSKSKKIQTTPTSSSFNRQLLNIQQKAQQPQSPQKQDPASSTQAEAKKRVVAPITDGPTENFSGGLIPHNEQSKLPPHLRLRPSPETASPVKIDQVTENQDTNVAPHRRRGPNKSEAGRLGGPHEITNNSPRSPQVTSQPHKQSSYPEEEMRPGGAETGMQTDAHPTDKTNDPITSNDIVGTENDAQIAAAIAAEDNENDAQIAAALQDTFSEAHHDSVKSAYERQEEVSFVPPHLRKPKLKPLSLDTATLPNVSTALDTPSTKRTDRVTTPATPQGALKDVTHSCQNNKLNTKANGASSKWKGKGITDQTDTGNDPSNLAGWDGGWGPAPLGEDWEARSQVNRKDHATAAAIENWAEDRAADLETDRTEIEDTAMSLPKPKHPKTIPNPDDFNQAKRHLRAEDAIAAFKAQKLRDSSSRSENGLTKSEKRNSRRNVKEQINSVEYEPNQYAPEANIHLRPAEMRDMGQVTSLHNFYVKSTACANELEENDEIYWRARLQECFDEGDPFLLAIYDGENRDRKTQRKKSETIVGFAFAADYGLQKTAYRFTVELEIWVHHDYHHKGIGRSLLDRMLAALDPAYNFHECVPLLGKYDATRWCSGGHSIVKTILVNILHNKFNMNTLEWKKKWLEENNFEHQGTLWEIGQKFGEP